MECEICGRYIERGKRIKVESSIITACEECSGYGEVVSDVRLEVKKKDKIPQKPAPVVDIASETDNNEGGLIDDYPSVIRESRERLGLKQEELAKAINEPASLIQRIESGKIEPSIEIARRIQKRLKIKIIEKSGGGTESIQAKKNVSENKDAELTLGDLVVVKKRKK